MLKDLLTEFKTFILRGNVLQLAVAVVMGGAFGEVVSAANAHLIQPILGMIGGGKRSDLSWMDFSWLHLGSFLNAVINFLIIAAAVYFIIVKPLNKFFGEKKKDEPTVPPATLEDVVAELKALRADLNKQSAEPVNLNKGL